MAQFNIADAKARFSELVERALAGDEVVVARDNKPLLKLVPLGDGGRARTPGTARGQIRMTKDFDEPLADFEPVPVVPLLLDTHAFLWWVDDSPRLSRKARAAISRPEESCYLSLISCWEMAIKISLGRLELTQRLDRFVAEHMAANGLQPLSLQLPHAARVAELPFHHRDPFDRLLAAQAIEEGLSIVSADTIFTRYGVKRVW